MIPPARSTAGVLFAVGSLGVLTLADPAGAQAVALSVAPESSIATSVSVTTVFGSDTDGPIPAAVTGGAEASLSTVLDTIHGRVADSLQVTTSDLVFADTGFHLVIPPLAPIDISLVGIHGAFNDVVLAPGTAVAAHTSTFDLTPFEMEFTEGEFVVTDPPGVPAAGTLFDLQGEAVVVTTPSGGNLDVVIQIPISKTASTTDSGVTVDVTITGTVVLEGTVAVAPVPSMGPDALTALALALLVLGAWCSRCAGAPRPGSGRIRA